jgi:hypothetical protein
MIKITIILDDVEQYPGHVYHLLSDEAQNRALQLWEPEGRADRGGEEMEIDSDAVSQVSSVRRKPECAAASPTTA